MQEKIKLLIDQWNQVGIKLPLLHDPKTQMASVSFTMLWISFNVVLVGLIGKWAKYLDVDVQQSINWFLICAGLYFGRNVGVSPQKKENE